MIRISLIAAISIFLTVPVMSAEKEQLFAINAPDSTPLKVLCKVKDNSQTKVMIQFVEDKEGKPGIYGVNGRTYYPAEKITKTAYNLNGEPKSKNGLLENNELVKLYYEGNQGYMAGFITGTKIFFGDFIELYQCDHLKLVK